MKVKKNCQFCGNEFEGSPNKLYCGQRCVRSFYVMWRAYLKKKIMMKLEKENNNEFTKWNNLRLNSSLDAMRELAGLPARESAG